jgi:tetratricopeptide (TPR) repeat protein
MRPDTYRQTLHVQDRAREYVSRGDYGGAETCILAGLRSARVPVADRLFLWNELGMVYKHLGKFHKSQQLYSRALNEAPGRLQGPARDFFLADLYHNLGGLEHARRRFRVGEALARKGLQLRRKVASRRSLPLAADLGALAALLDGQKKFAEAEKIYRQALSIYRGEYGACHAEIAMLLGNIAALYQATGRFNSSLKHYRMALHMKRQKLGGSHPSVALTMNNLGMLYRAQGDNYQAKRYVGAALRILFHSLGSRHVQYNTVKNNYQTLLCNSRARS